MPFRYALTATTLAAFAGSPAVSQTPYPAETNLRFEVWDGAQWTNTVNAHPGDRIEWRAVISYVGTRTDIQGLAEVLYQPIIPNADNEGPVMDELGPWRNLGASGSSSSGSAGLLSESEGNDGGPLPSYGRVGFGLIGSGPQSQNIHTSFRHTNGTNGAPPGSWLRIAGWYCSQWAVDGSSAVWTPSDTNRLLRGMTAGQMSRLTSAYPSTGGVNPYWRGGTQDLVILRQALFVGDDATDRAVAITTDERFLRRAGMSFGSTDNRRYVNWYTEDSQEQDDAYRTSLTITPAIAFVTVPAPGTAVVIGTFAWVCARRHRSGLRGQNGPATSTSAHTP